MVTEKDIENFKLHKIEMVDVKHRYSYLSHKIIEFENKVKAQLKPICDKFKTFDDVYYQIEMTKHNIYVHVYFNGTESLKIMIDYEHLPNIKTYEDLTKWIVKKI